MVVANPDILAQIDEVLEEVRPQLPSVQKQQEILGIDEVPSSRDPFIGHSAVLGERRRHFPLIDVRLEERE